ncbi:hypothetical protein FQZ97_741160 [compost metagenome]
MTFLLPYTPSPSSIRVTRLPRPSIVTFDGTRSCESRTIVMSDAKRIHAGPFLACASAARSVPGPESSSEVTSMNLPLSPPVALAP